MARSRVQSIRSNVSGARPASQEPGTIYTNFADLQIGVADTARQPKDLVAVRYFATTASYTPGQLVVQNGKVYRAVAVISPGAFDPTKWQEITVQSGSGIWVGDEPRAEAPVQGQLLWESDSGDLFVWYEDADSGQWVQINVVGDTTPNFWRLRSDLVSAIGAGAVGIAEGAVYTAGGYGYVGKPGSTMIPDLPGLEPFGEAYIVHWGALPDGSNSMPAIKAMDNGVGRITVPAGGFTCATMGVTPTENDVAIYEYLKFEQGGWFDVPAGSTMWIYNSIESSKQWIFRGDGDYRMRGISAQTFPIEDEKLPGRGGQSRWVHISWFGALSSSENVDFDAAPAIVKALASVATADFYESRIQLDFGSYKLKTLTPIQVGRAVWIQGAGTRRCNFTICNDTGNTFETAGVAVKFTDIGFETEYRPVATPGGANFLKTDGYAIAVNHGDFEASDLGSANCQLLYVNANRTRIQNITSGSSAGALPAGSALIHMAGGGGWQVSNVHGNNSPSPGVESLVRVGGGTATCTNWIIENLSWISQNRGVTLDASTVGVVRGIINNLSYSGSTAVDCGIVIQNSGVNPIDGIMISNVSLQSTAETGIRISNNATHADGLISDIQISNTHTNGSSGAGIGIDIQRNATGLIQDVFIAETCNLQERATPIAYPAGGFSNIVVPPALRPATVGPTAATPLVYGHTPVTYAPFVEDDNVVNIDLRRNVFSGIVLVASTVNYGMFTFRAVATTSIQTLFTASANMAITNALDLLGTTGTDGKLTVGVGKPGFIQVENRLGASIQLSIVLFRGPPL